MRKILQAFVVISLVFVPALFAQTLDDYTLEVRGDTLVIKDFIDMGNKPSSINQVFALDTAPPAGRVYELKANGYYPMASNPQTPARPVVIVGAIKEKVVKATGDALPIICGYSGNSGAITFTDNLTVKNCAVYQIAADGTLGWAFWGASNPDKTITLENCLMEHTRWVMIQSNDAPGTTVRINDCYFVNMTGQACRRNGGVYDNVNHNTTEVFVENSTHVMAQGMIYKFRDYPVGKAWFNHNTFINMGSYVFENIGYLSNYVVTNNIFINCNVQPYMKGLDYDETDADSLPTGIINVRNLPSDYEQLDRKILVDRNVVYWSPELSDVVSQVSAAKTNGTSEWYDQMITMNSRTQAMFDDNATYPYLTEGIWYKQMPTFTDPKDLFTTQLANFKKFCIATVDQASADIMPVWRLVYTDPGDYIYSDWPIPIDLSYSDANLLTGGTGGFPVGDLNWFPDKKAEWEAQKDAEHAAIQDALDKGQLPGLANLVTNGSFELSDVGPVTTIVGWSLEGTATPAPNFAIVNDPVQDGSKALAVTINALGANAWNIQAVAENIPVQPGKTYHYSIWAKTSDAGGSKVSFTVGNPAYSEYMRLHEKSLTTEWQEFTGTFTINDNYTTARAPIHFSISGNVGDIIYIDNLKITPPAVSVEEKIETLPEGYVLRQNYPNPFNPTTTIEFAIPKSGLVTLKVYDALGREVATLVNGFKNGSESYRVEFDGSGLASGMYIYKLTVDNYSATRKMILMK
ncbi:MAG: carbohydrate binding domain-containing protein [candidate division KSB1 bacterium]|nr:carbohydrate binding domain-containing protein [candidate division KSB1 bacterium]